MYQLPTLPYKYDALEPQIDENTMRIHHTKHHQKYIDNLNNALKSTKYPETTVGLLLNLIKKTSDLDTRLRNVLNFNAGSHYNHTMYWHCMSSEPAHKEMMRPLHDQIGKDFGDMNQLREKFLGECMGILGIGWQWLCYNSTDKKLVLYTTYQQDNPLIMKDNLFPILACDLWEHAYYLKFNANKKDFLDGWYELINWENVSVFYDMVVDGKIVDFMHDGKVNLFESAQK